MCVKDWSYAKNWRQSRVDSAKLAREKKRWAGLFLCNPTAALWARIVQNVKKPLSHSECYRFWIFCFYPYEFLVVHLVLKSHDRLVELYRSTRCIQGAFCSISKISLKSPHSSSWIFWCQPRWWFLHKKRMNLYKSFLHVHPFFVVYPLEGQVSEKSGNTINRNFSEILEMEQNAPFFSLHTSCELE